MKGLLFLISFLLIFSCKMPRSQHDDTDPEPEEFTATKRIYWGRWDGAEGTITRADINSPEETEVIVDGLDYRPGQIEIDSSGGKIYWTDETTGVDIIWANLDGSAMETIISELIDDFCINTENNKIYAACMNNKIWDANLDGSDLSFGLEINCLETFGISSIAVDESAAKLFWVINSTTLYQSNIDGTGIIEIYSGSIQFDIELDTVNSRIYFLPDLSVLGVSYINYDGTGFEVLTQMGQTDIYIYEIDLVNELLYFEFFDGVFNNIKYCDLDGENINPLLQIDTTDWITGIAFEYE